MARLAITLTLLCGILAGCAGTGADPGTKPDYQAPTMNRSGY